MVGDVAWHQQNPKLLGSVGDDKQLLFWDTSMDGSKPTTVIPNVRKERGRGRGEEKKRDETNVWRNIVIENTRKREGGLGSTAAR